MLIIVDKLIRISFSLNDDVMRIFSRVLTAILFFLIGVSISQRFLSFTFYCMTDVMILILFLNIPHEIRLGIAFYIGLTFNSLFTESYLMNDVLTVITLFSGFSVLFIVSMMLTDQYHNACILFVMLISVVTVFMDLFFIEIQFINIGVVIGLTVVFDMCIGPFLENILKI